MLTSILCPIQAGAFANNKKDVRLNLRAATAEELNSRSRRLPAQRHSTSGYQSQQRKLNVRHATAN